MQQPQWAVMNTEREKEGVREGERERGREGEGERERERGKEIEK